MTSKLIAITSGDIDGIGLEVSIKALESIGPLPDTKFLLWRSKKEYPIALSSLADQSVHTKDPQKALEWASADNAPPIIEIFSEESPALWVEQCALWAKQQRIHGMVTAPLSKTEVRRSGLQDMGHTGILKRVAQVESVFMGFVGKHFNVVLATDHIPLNEVEKRLTSEQLLKALKAAQQLKSLLELTQPIGLVGLNPHAGEEGLIGSTEAQVYPEVLSQAQQLGWQVRGPLIPDAAYLPEQWDQFSCYLSAYHDQGLIPFKMTHGQDSGVQISLGLDFLRTSVDHGTAKGLYGKNRANPGSMIEAIKWAVQLCPKYI